MKSGRRLGNVLTKEGSDVEAGVLVEATSQELADPWFELGMAVARCVEALVPTETLLSDSCVFCTNALPVLRPPDVTFCYVLVE